MKIFTSKFRILIMGILFSVILMSAHIPTTFALTEEQDLGLLDQYIGDELSLARCIAKGNIDFILFMQSIIYSDGFYEGIIEPFNDVLIRNQCHGNDVIGLIKQRDKIRDSIRKSFLTCSNDRIPNLKKAYSKVNAEIYYVRHIVDGGIVLALPFELLSTRMLQDPESLFVPRKVIYDEMKTKYVDSGIFEINAFNTMFNNLETKYKKRKESYVVCEGGAWDGVSEKWAEFLDTAGGITPALSSAKNKIAGRAEKIGEAITDIGFESYLKGVIKLNVNDQTPAAGFGEILGELNDLASGPVFVPTTYSQVSTNLGKEEFKFNIESIRLELDSKFSVLYKDASDSYIEIMLEELKNLDKTILGSLDVMDQVLNCVNTMNSRQCPGN